MGFGVICSIVSPPSGGACFSISGRGPFSVFRPCFGIVGCRPSFRSIPQDFGGAQGFANQGWRMRDTCHFRHFQEPEEQTPCFCGQNMQSSSSPFSSPPPVLKTPFAKKSVCVLRRIWDVGRRQNTPENAGDRAFLESAFSGALWFHVCFGPLLEENKEHLQV